MTCPGGPAEEAVQGLGSVLDAISVCNRFSASMIRQRIVDVEHQ